LKHPKRTLFLAVFCVAVWIAGVYWAVRGVPINGRNAQVFEGWLSSKLGIEVSFQDAWFHPPTVVTFRKLAIHEFGKPPVTIEMDALRLSAVPWNLKDGIDLEAKGTTLYLEDKMSPTIPRLRTKLQRLPNGIAWDEAQFYLSVFGQPTHGVLSSGFLKNTASAGEVSLLEYKTDIELTIRSFGVWARIIGNELAAEVVGRLGYGPGDASPLSASLAFAEGKIWVDPIRLGSGPELEAALDLSAKTLEKYTSPN